MLNTKDRIQGTDYKIQNSKHKIQDTLSSFGFTLIETLVVLSVFSILAVLVTSVIIYSLRGTRKSENTSKVRAQLNEAVEVIERQLKNAKSIESVVYSGQDDPLQRCSSSGSAINKSGKKLFYTDQSGKPTYFECIGGENGGIASDSASVIANQGINITICEFTYTNPCEVGIPENVTFKVVGSTTGVTSTESAGVSVETNIQLRNYK